MKPLVALPKPLARQLTRRRRSEFEAPPTQLEQQLVPVITVMIASLAPLLPFIATQPIMPPLGFITLVAWRLLRNDLWPAWAGLPLGLFDDLFSGAPIGTAIAGWTIVLIVIDLIDTRLVWRDYWQDWIIAVLLVIGHLLYGVLLARLTGGGISPILLLPQMLVSALAYPIIMRMVATLDHWRGSR